MPEAPVVADLLQALPVRGDRRIVAANQRGMQMVVNPEPFMNIGGGTIVVLNRPD